MMAVHRGVNSSNILSVYTYTDFSTGTVYKLMLDFALSKTE